MNNRKRDRLFKTYVEPFAVDIYRIINNIFDDNELSNDIAQIVLEKAWTHLPSLRSEEKAKQWINSIIRNEIRMEFRRRKSKYQFVSLEEQPITLIMSQEECDLMESDVLAILEKKEQRRQMIEAIRQLSRNEQLIIRLHLMEDMTFKEIGEIMGVKPDTVKHRFYRAVDKAKVIYHDMEKGGTHDVQ